MTTSTSVQPVAAPSGRSTRPRIDAAEVRRTFAAAHQAAVRGGGPVLVAWTRPLAGITPRALLRHADGLSGRVFSWASRWTGVESLGIGSSLDLSAEGAGRFEVVRRGWRRYAAGLVTGGSGIAGTPGFPLLVGGFAFQTGRWHPTGGLPDALTWCPAVHVVRLGDGSTHLALTGRLTPADDPVALADRRVELALRLLTPTAPVTDEPPGFVVRFDLPDAGQWQRNVSAALDEIDRGGLTKVVMARQVVLHASRPFGVPAAVDRLAEGFGEGAVFAARFNGYWFLGGTPECLVRVANRHVVADSLAGSMARGATASADAARARTLLHGAKTRHEQGLVTEFVTDALTGCCVDIEAADRPRILRLGNVQHLVTTVTARIPEPGRSDPARIPEPGRSDPATVPGDGPVGLLDLAERLHPTPAMGGYPADAALDWIARSEPFDRGWYSAPVGWLDAVQEGELAVAIRSALVSGSRAALFAGCGVVAGSTPEDEYAETELKLRPMLTALGVAPAVWPAQGERAAAGVGRAAA